jgi:tetratricopeptide (TPR) repeat protein
VIGNRVADRVYAYCAFESVSFPARAAEPTDLIVDVVVGARLGGIGSSIQLVLSDSISDELLGSVEIDSYNGLSDVVISGAADYIGQLLNRSGCKLPRIPRSPAPAIALSTPALSTSARNHPAASVQAPGASQPVPTASPPGPGTSPPGTRAGTDPSPSDASAAEEKNKRGKELFRDGNFVAARQQFEEALALQPDARFEFNLCLAYDALGNIPAARAACRQAREMNPSAALDEKIKLRLEIITTTAQAK